MRINSRVLAWFIIIAGTALSGILKDSTYFAIAVPSAAGLYANRQYQTRKEREIKNNIDEV